MLLRIIGTNLPGRACGDHTNVHVGIQVRRDPEQVVPADTDPATFTAQVTVFAGRDGDPDLRGPAVQGRPGDRFIYLSWGDLSATGAFKMFRRAKLMLAAVGPGVIREADESGGVLEARLGLTDRHGMPVCAAVRPPHVTWAAVAG